jgi:hypothetical protein
LNAWGVVIIALGGGLIYWAVKHTGSLSELLGGSTTAKEAVTAVNEVTPTNPTSLPSIFEPGGYGALSLYRGVFEDKW